ncbi:MAG: hypothetical protein HY842_12000 [Bacteroidetes bacterium]|nr:hypothetical protein [Bacteroidota bacterium]
MVAEISPVLDDFAEFLSKLAPRKVLDYKASPKSQERVNYLLEKNRTSNLTADEQKEMNYHMMIEYIVRVAKTRALQRLNTSQQ